MKDDVTSRRRKQTPHQRLRLEKAKELRRLGALTKKKRAESRKQTPGETDPEKMVDIALGLPNARKDTLAKSTKQPPAKFRKRQVHKAWLPTHLYHAKRAHMSAPKEPLWRFAIPLTPTEKCYRPTHRAASSRGCVAWDTSYMSIIAAHGVETSLSGLLRSVGVEEAMLVGNQGAKWRRGTRGWTGWIRERDNEKKWISNVEIVWCLEEKSTTDCTLVTCGQEIKQGRPSGQAEGSTAVHTKTVADGNTRKSQRAEKRKLFIRVHPCAFFQVWNEVLKVAKIQHPPVMVEDLRFEIGSIEIVGPGSTEALISALRPVSTEPNAEEARVDIDSPAKVWSQLASVTNPGALPPNVVLGFNISDPRLHHPPRTVHVDKSKTTDDGLLELLSSWPPDQTHTALDIFDRTKRLAASRKLASQKAINRRKADALPGAYPDPSSKDPHLPVLLIASRAPTSASQGSWTLLLPWDCVLPIWYSLMHYPLSSSGNPRFGGLREKQQMSFEQGVPWFPGDYPGTKAGFEWELMERERKKREWERRPRGKRVAWDSIKLGTEKKGEIGIGWGCDWERLLQTPLGMDEDTEMPTAKSPKDAAANPDLSARANNPSLSAKEKRPTPEQPSTKSPPLPPLQIHQLIAPFPSSLSPASQTALTTIHLTLILTGRPSRCARIYRLPTTDLVLRTKWLALLAGTKTRNQKQSTKPNPTTSLTGDISWPAHIRAQSLATALLTPNTAADDAAAAVYPPVPGEEDLIGFVTTGNFNLGEGRSEAIGNVAVAKVMPAQEPEEGEGLTATAGLEKKTTKDERKKAAGRMENRVGEERLCIVRDAGLSVGRLARWRFV